MKKEYINIPTLLCRKVTGLISAEEEAILAEWAAMNEANRKAYEQFTSSDFLGQEMRTALEVDPVRPRQEMESRLGLDGKELEVRGLEVRGERNASSAENISLTSHRSLLTSKKILRYAAVILIFIIGGAAWWYRDYTRVTPPEISEAVQLAMQMSKESGKMEAEVMSYGGERREESGERNASSAGNQQQDYSPSSLPTPPSSDISAEDILSARRITTYHDKEYWVTLDDGTLVHLNYNTHLIYPEKFGRKNRTVILDGEAYFMVAKDKSRPFIVHTPNGDVKVYGTEFNVNTNTLTSHPSPLTSVTLVHGSVSVTPTGGKEQLLKPGQQATYNAQSSTFNVQSVDIEPYVAWNTGKLMFTDKTLEYIMEVLARWYGYQVVYASDDIRQVSLSGVFDRYKDVHHTLQALSTVTGLEINIQNNQIIINH